MSDDKAIVLEVFYGVSSPWALLGAPRVEEIGKKYNLTVHLRPIVIIEANGGIPLRTRTEARQDYHALDLARCAKKLGVPMVPKPKYYPPPPGGISLAAQAIIRVQKMLGRGHPLALAFSYAIQRCIWIDEGNYCDLEVLKSLGRQVGLPENVVDQAIIDRRGDTEDEGVKEWQQNLKDAEAIGIFGTPNYVVNGEIFWGQDRLDFVEDRIQELLAAGYKAT
ncbi:thioredoxin-like protein [Schizophyllum commune]